MARAALLLLLHHLHLHLHLLLLGLVGGEPQCRLPGQAASNNMGARVAALFENTVCSINANLRPQIDANIGLSTYIM